MSGFWKREPFVIPGYWCLLPRRNRLWPSTAQVATLKRNNAMPGPLKLWPACSCFMNATSPLSVLEVRHFTADRRLRPKPAVLSMPEVHLWFSKASVRFKTKRGRADYRTTPLHRAASMLLERTELSRQWLPKGFSTGRLATSISIGNGGLSPVVGQCRFC